MSLGVPGKPQVGTRSILISPQMWRWPEIGSFYVSDGYGNRRVAKFSAEGRFLLEWGRDGEGPGEFKEVHNVVVDDASRCMWPTASTAVFKFSRQWRIRVRVEE